ncbi:MAG: HD domain-containing protein [Chloroflexota bacterium]|nr:HD domain-containing protein [Chloroflexota bacterium]
MQQQEGYAQQYEEALQLAAVAHHQQMRKGGELPYIVHPVHVSVILLRHGFAMEVAIAGLLHDVVEDQGYDLTEIERQFGPRVAEMVGALTERKRDAGGEKRPWEVRKREALEQIRGASKETVAVKAADTLHNAYSSVQDLRQQGSQIWRYFNRGPQSQLDYYRQVLHLTEKRLGDHPLTAELADALSKLEQAVNQTGAEDETLMP